MRKGMLVVSVPGHLEDVLDRVRALLVDDVARVVLLSSVVPISAMSLRSGARQAKQGKTGGNGSPAAEGRSHGSGVLTNFLGMAAQRRPGRNKRPKHYDKQKPVELGMNITVCISAR